MKRRFILAIACAAISSTMAAQQADSTEVVSDVTEEVIYNNDKYIAETIKKADPNAVYIITGYADKGTGSIERNVILSKNRARVVYECLVNEFGVPKKQLRVDHKGGVDNMFYNDPRLSRAVITKILEEKE